jgi:hypothetical protein
MYAVARRIADCQNFKIFTCFLMSLQLLLLNWRVLRGIGLVEYSTNY